MHYCNCFNFVFFTILSFTSYSSCLTCLFLILVGLLSDMEAQGGGNGNYHPGDWVFAQPSLASHALHFAPNMSLLSKKYKAEFCDYITWCGLWDLYSYLAGKFEMEQRSVAPLKGGDLKADQKPSNISGQKIVFLQNFYFSISWLTCLFVVKKLVPASNVAASRL